MFSPNGSCGLSARPPPPPTEDLSHLGTLAGPQISAHQSSKLESSHKGEERSQFSLCKKLGGGRERQSGRGPMEGWCWLAQFSQLPEGGRVCRDEVKSTQAGLGGPCGQGGKGQVSRGGPQAGEWGFMPSRGLSWWSEACEVMHHLDLCYHQQGPAAVPEGHRLEAAGRGLVPGGWGYLWFGATKPVLKGGQPHPGPFQRASLV